MRKAIESRWKDLPRVALESRVLEAYKALTAPQLRKLLGFATSKADAMGKAQADGKMGKDLALNHFRRQRIRQVEEAFGVY